MAEHQTSSVVVYGEEEFFLDRYLQKVKSVTNREIVVLDGSSVSGSGIVSECRAYSMSDRKVVLVEDAHDVKPSSELDTYAKKQVAVSLVAICKGKTLPKAWAAVAEAGKVLHWPKFKTWDNNNEVLAWIERESKDLGLELDEVVPKILFDFYGDDLYCIASELRKLTWLVERGQRVTSDIVRSIALRTRSSTGFRVADAVFTKDLRRALHEFSLLCHSASENSAAILTVSALQKQTCKLLLARQALDRGGSEEEVASQLEMHPWRFKTYFLPMVQTFASSALLRAMGSLCRLDLDVKGQARGSKRTMVELFLLDLVNTA